MEKDLKLLSMEIRRDILKMAYMAGGSHIAPSFSCVEILVGLYFGGVLRYRPDEPDWKQRDRFILSKGHASAALYAVLSKSGYFDKSMLDTYCTNGTTLGGHPKMGDIPGVEASTGALGHGLLFGAGIALAAQKDKLDYNVYVLLGDGECQEGSIWECALFSAQAGLKNLTAIIDYNKLQAMDKLSNIVGMESMADKWKAFGWQVEEVDGHDALSLSESLKKNRGKGSAPHLIIAHTTKGKGLSFMEDKPIWHYRMPDKSEMEIALKELEFEDREWLKK